MKAKRVMIMKSLRKKMEKVKKMTKLMKMTMVTLTLGNVWDRRQVWCPPTLVTVTEKMSTGPGTAPGVGNR